MAILSYKITHNSDNTLYVDYPSSVVSTFEDIKISVQHNLKTVSRIEITLENEEGIELTSIMTPDGTFYNTQSIQLDTLIDVESLDEYALSKLLVTFNFVLESTEELSTGKLNFRLFKSDDDITYTRTDMEQAYSAINGFGYIFQKVFKYLTTYDDKIDANIELVEKLQNEMNDVINVNTTITTMQESITNLNNDITELRADIQAIKDVLVAFESEGGTS